MNELKAINGFAAKSRRHRMLGDWPGWTICLDMRIDTSLVRGDPDPWKSATPAAAVDGTQEALDLRVEGERLFQIDGMAGIGADPQTRIAKRRFEHQVGIEAANVFVADREQYRNSQL